MQTNFSPSVNILRDADKKIGYIPTANTERIVRQIVNDYKIGIRSFNIIGSYGTGKSSFLLAFERNLRGERHDFGSINGQFGNVEKFTFWKIVGEYHSITDSFSHTLNLQETPHSTQQIIHELDQTYQTIHQENACLVIVIDELGKFLEYAASHSPENELYFIQQLAEYTNDTAKNIVLLTTLHQSFDAYSRSLDTTQRQEWEKVKGRLKELTFNEPVELLLNLAAEYLEANFSIEKPDESICEIVELINQSRSFPHRTALTEELARKLYPFDPLAAAVLTLALQRYGQNERSLFTFLTTNDYLGINDYDTKLNPYYNVACVYDYLLYNYFSLLSTKYNPHYAQWAAIRRAIERIEGTFEERVVEASKLAKTIGLLNIFTTEDAKIDEDFLTNYTRLTFGIENPQELLKKLETSKIIRYVAFKRKFILFEGTDLDIELALLDAATKVDPVKDVITPLKDYFDFPYVSAKAVSYKQGTPRFFAFKLSEIPLEIKPEGEIDGIINLVFSETLTLEEIKAVSAKQHEAILYGLYRNTRQIRNILFEIAKIDYLITTHSEDRIAVQELKNLKNHQIEELNRHVLDRLYVNSDDVMWVFAGNEIEIKSHADLNARLSRICEQVYCKTPLFRNELVNRHKLSGAISTARRNFIRALLDHWTEEDLGFPNEKFPPEKTIYLTLLKETGVHRSTEHGYTLDQPTELSFQELWRKCEAFLESAKPARRNLQELIDILSAKLLKLKQGLIDFWLPVFLFIKREDFALYHEDVYIPDLNAEILELINRKPDRFQIKTFDVQGVKLDLFNKYRDLLHQSTGEQFTSTSFIETVKPFLTFYNNLSEYTKQTKKLPKDAIRLRDAIANAKDPEKTFFEDFPQALGYVHFDLKEIDDSHLKDYVFQLQKSLQDIQTCFDSLIDRFEEHLLREWGYTSLQFPDYRTKLKERYRSLKKNLLLRHQKPFYARLLVEHTDRKEWIGSLVHVVLNKKVTQMKDEEEEVVLDRLSNIIRELDNLCNMAKSGVDPDKEEVLKLEVTSLTDGTQKQLVRVPKQKMDDLVNLEKDIENILLKSKDKTGNIFILTKLLQKELKS
jgi:hypothetical protein